MLAGGRDVDCGSPYENFVAQELLASGHGLFCHANSKRGEVDFVIEDKASGDVSLVEAKSGKSHKRRVALSNLLAVRDCQIAEAIVMRRP